MTPPLPISKDLRKLMALGSGVGIGIGATDLEVVAAKVRPSGVQVLGRLMIASYASRPAAEWGAEYARFLKSLGASYLSATVLLPRRDVIVRHVSLPGVATKDIDGAIRFQLDTLHPYGEEEIAWGWSALGYGAVLVGVARRTRWIGTTSFSMRRASLWPPSRSPPPRCTRPSGSTVPRPRKASWR